MPQLQELYNAAINSTAVEDIDLHGDELASVRSKTETALLSLDGQPTSRQGMLRLSHGKTQHDFSPPRWVLSWLTITYHFYFFVSMLRPPLSCSIRRLSAFFAAAPTAYLLSSLSTVVLRWTRIYHLVNGLHIQLKFHTVRLALNPYYSNHEGTFM